MAALQLSMNFGIPEAAVERCFERGFSLHCLFSTYWLCLIRWDQSRIQGEFSDQNQSGVVDQLFSYLEDFLNGDLKDIFLLLISCGWSSNSNSSTSAPILQDCGFDGCEEAASVSTPFVRLSTNSPDIIFFGSHSNFCKNKIYNMWYEPWGQKLSYTELQQSWQKAMLIFGKITSWILFPMINVCCMFYQVICTSKKFCTK